MFDRIHWLEAYFIDDHERRRKGVQQQPGARWEHVDVEKAGWHIPAENSTTGGVCGRNPELV